MPLAHHDHAVTVPAGASFLRCGFQSDDSTDLTVWYLCNPKAPKDTRTLRVFGTGWDIPNDPEDPEVYFYIDTAFSRGFVWHLFELDIDSGSYDDGTDPLLNS
jgi:hypothetical protein